MLNHRLVALLALLLLAACTPHADAETAPDSATRATAVFAGGCFWCMEPPFEKLDGVLDVQSGYSGGVTPNPTYQAVSSGTTGHIEVVQVIYDPSKIGWSALLETFWRNIDPTVANRQFCDGGAHYRSAIFVSNAAERTAAQASKDAVAANPRFAGKTIYTEILDAATFYPAEAYHQDYARNNPVRYNYYRWSCGRDARLTEVWGDVFKESKQ